MLEKLAKFDRLRRPPQDFLAEPTLPGAIISIAAGVAIVLLTLSELVLFLSPATTSDMFVSAVNHGADMRVNLNMSFPFIPCGVLSLDAQDAMGGHSVDVGGALHKMRTKNGRDVGIEKPLQSTGMQVSEEDKKHLEEQKGEGCRLEGHLIVKKVPGNWHCSAHAHAPLLPYAGVTDALKLDTRHIVHALSFSEVTTTPEEAESIKKLSGAFHPLDGIQRMDASLVGQTIEHYLEIVPTTYASADHGKDIHAFQFTANSHHLKHERMLPAVYFRYSVSPVSVLYKDSGESFLHFVVQLCAVIGGVFTVAELVNRAAARSLVPMLKKFEMGKLA